MRLWLNGLLLLKRERLMSLEISDLIKAMQDQTKAINNLVESNRQVIALLTEVVSYQVEDQSDGMELNFLDGSSAG